MDAGSSDPLDMWRVIPPEEKLMLMARAQSEGVLTVLGLVISAAAAAVALQIVWIFWGSFVLAPFVFQFAAGRSWRTLRPGLILEYLAVRSAARRYAFNARAKDMTLKLIFRAESERIYSQSEQTEALEATIQNIAKSQVWIALFKDAVVLMSEGKGGAKAEFAHLINDKLSVSGSSRSGDESEYAPDRELVLSCQVRDSQKRISLKVRSDYPAALIAFEQTLKKGLKDVQDRLTSGTLAREKQAESVETEQPSSML